MNKGADELIGGFRVLESLHGGSGAQGVVSKAVCERPDLPGVSVGEIVALKVMSVADEDGSRFRRLQRRTEELAALNHPNIVQYRGCFQVVEAFKSQHVVVMEFLDGETLKDRLAAARHGLDADEALSIVTKAVVGLQRAAEAGIVHRDVKPANIFLCRDGSVKIIDFEYAHSDSGGVSTTGGRFLGTFDYMAPEFTNADFRGDERSDVFSMGVVLHETLCGQPPYAEVRRGGGRQADFEFLSRWSDAAGREAALRIRPRAYCALSGMKEVLERVLMPDCKRRFASFAELKAALDAVRYREFCNEGRHYRLLRQVGKGGFGEVFKARMTPVGRLVAVKSLLKAAYGDRFRREARIMQRFQSPCLTRFIDYFEVERGGASESYLVMDFLPDMPGSSLRDAINASAPSRLDPGAVVTAFARYARGLAVLHDGTVYHRDIKPSNLYFPKGNPEGAVIMDMGIARDAGGSVTCGDVPGTLDYMPPEIVTLSGRGDARMDIYALGLSLYEALTGRQAFPRLPSGSDGLREFYRRSKALATPAFDDAEIVRRPAVLDLLRLMTHPDCSKRLGDAHELERRLLALDWSAVQAPAHARHSASAPRRSQPSRAEAATRETSSRGGGQERPLLPPSAVRWMARCALGLVAACVLGVAGYFLVDPVSKGVDRLRSWQVDRKIVADIEAQASEARARAAADDLRLRKENANLCREEADVVAAAYGKALSHEGPDGEFEQWKAKWTHRPLPDGALDDCQSLIAAARESCAGRQADRQKAAENEADVVLSEYMNARTAEKGDALAADWRKKWSDKGIPTSALERRLKEFGTARADCQERLRQMEQAETAAVTRHAQLEQRLDCARSESKAVRDSYSDLAVRLSTADREYASWQGRWGALADSAAYKAIDAELRAAKDEREKRERERGVFEECRALIGNVMTTTSSNVRNWRASLDRAGNEVKEASRSGRLSESGRETLEREIAAVRKWHVGVIDNKSHETLSFMGRKVPPVTESLFVFTNGLPPQAAISCDGYEPIRVTAAQFDRRTFVVMKSDLVPAEGRAFLDIPALGEGVVCLVDGVMRESGRTRLSLGRHECVYRNLRETQPGVADFAEQRQVVVLDGGQHRRLDPPGAWVESEEFKSARAAAQSDEKGAEVALAVEKGLETMPVETRRERLEKVFSILHNWQTPALLGNRRLTELKAKYEFEHARVIGRVANELTVPLRVKVRDNWITVRPGASEIIAYDGGMPADARIAVEGYEYLQLPDAGGFDGKTFFVTAAKLEPTPVMVTVPNLEEGATCRIAGRLTSDTVELKPGRYVCVYSREGYADQRFAIEVAVGRDLTVSPPKAWERTGALGRLVDRVNDVKESAGRGLQSAKDALEYR